MPKKIDLDLYSTTTGDAATAKAQVARVMTVKALELAQEIWTGAALVTFKSYSVSDTDDLLRVRLLMVRAADGRVLWFHDCAATHSDVQGPDDIQEVDEEALDRVEELLEEAGRAIGELDVELGLYGGACDQELTDLALQGDEDEFSYVYDLVDVRLLPPVALCALFRAKL